MFFIVLAISFVCELVDSSLGMGYGTLLTPILLLIGFNPSDIIPTVLLSELFTGFTAAYSHDQIKNVDFSFKGTHLTSALILTGGSLVGVIIGVFLSITIDETMVRRTIGGIVLFSGALVLLFSKRQIIYRHWKMIILSTLAAFNKTVSGGGYGPLLTSGQILSGIEGKSAIGITCLAEAFTCLMGVIIFMLQGKTLTYSLLGPVLAGALLSVPFSVHFVSRFQENRLKILIGILTITLGALTILK